MKHAIIQALALAVSMAAAGGAAAQKADDAMTAPQIHWP